MTEFYSNGKLLITGEYLVLDGAQALALPTKLGQTLRVRESIMPLIIWKSLDEAGNIWFECTITIESLKIKSSNNTQMAERLASILVESRKLNSQFLNGTNGFNVTTKLDFPSNWGLGSSSTLINNIAMWANVDAYVLLANTFGGSGYDIACAQNNSALIYKLKENKPVVCKIEFNPDFRKHLYFVHLNKKRNSREAISQYKLNSQYPIAEIETMNGLTEQICKSENIKEFSTLIDSHENLMGSLLNQTPVKKLLFKDFSGSVKSLGAWGGDFIMAVSEDNPTGYFKEMGYQTLMTYDDLILN